jgi:uncharacterized protein (TIGR03790 family)
MLVLAFSFLVTCAAEQACALEPNEILVIANGNSPASVRIAQHYCQKRDVPPKNILKLDLKEELADDITRSDYEKLIARPIHARIGETDSSGGIKCLLTVYGVPFRVGARGMLEAERETLVKLSELARQKTDRLIEIIRQLEVISGAEYAIFVDTAKRPPAKKILKDLDSYIRDTRARIDAAGNESQKILHLKHWFRLYLELCGRTKASQAAEAETEPPVLLTGPDETEIKRCRRLFDRAEREKWGFGKCLKAGFYDAVQAVAGLEGVLLRLNADIDNIRGTETGASVDSELSMVMFDDYELYGRQLNEFKERLFWTDTRTLMVCRLDGPGEDIASALVDKALSAERNGLKGIAYIDSGYSVKKKPPLYGEYDESLQQTAVMIARRTGINVVQEQTPALFAPGECPDTALYCGWYSLKKYVDAFDFVAGAAGYHIASWEAVDLHNPKSTQWCPAMLKDGITATIGAVAEPYLAAFPKPDMFFGQLINGKCLAEAYYRTKPYNSWQMVLIGDPLYAPFK